MAAMFDLTLKKKKKKPKKETVTVADEGDVDQPKIDGGESAAGTKDDKETADISIFVLDPPSYTYSQLLSRVVDFVQENNPELTDKKRFTMKPPQLMRGIFAFFI